MKRAKVLLTFLTIMSLLLITACSKPAAPASDPAPAAPPAQSGDPAPAAEPAKEPEKPKEPTVVRFSEVIHSIFYTPQYVAMGLDFFGEEGLTLDTSTAQGSDRGVAALLAGIADVALVGPEAAIFLQNQESPTKVKIFAQLTAKDGSFLVSRQKVDSFQWSDMKGKTIIGWRPGSMPQMVMNKMLQDNGVTDANVITNLAAPAMAGAFQSGQGDFIQLFEPTVALLEKENAGHFVLSMGEAAGPFPYTVYMATDEFIAKRPDVVQAYTRAIYRGMLWTQSHSAAEVAQVIQPFFAETPMELLEASVARYKNQDTWAPTPVLDPAQLELLQDVMVLGGVLEPAKRVKYSDVVLTNFAEQAMQEVK